ncbi:reverse transcriptase domain-containing protein [Tanacetum coccineum]
MDLKWQVAMVSMRLRKFYKKTGRKLSFNAKEPIGFDKTKVECFNCHKTGHFARECRSKGNQGIRMRDVGNTGYKAKDNGRRPGKQEEPKALVTLDGDGVDWTSHAKDEQENFALMAYNNSGSDTEERISKKRMKNEAKTTKPDTEWKSVEKTKSRPSPSVKKSTQVNPDKSRSQQVKKNNTLRLRATAIVVPEIIADNFELKHGLLNLVQNKQFFGHDKEDPHAHIRYFNKITSTMKFPPFRCTSVKAYAFPFSSRGAARNLARNRTPRSSQTWDDLVSKFINKFFPPSKTTNLRNEITRFQQRFDETFYDAEIAFNDFLSGMLFNLLLIKLRLIKLSSSIFKGIEGGFQSLSYKALHDAVMRKHAKSSLPKKLGDPGRFLIPCEFSGINTCNALADLGASINLIPYSVWKTLSFPELTPTCMTLELADRSIFEPIGIAEDVYVTAGKFQFPADFVVVDFEPGPESLISGRSILKTVVQLSMYTRNTLKKFLGFLICDSSGKHTPSLSQSSYCFSTLYTPFIGDSDLLIEVLKSTSENAWENFSDIKWSLNQSFVPIKFMEEDYEPSVQHQRRVNPKIHDVIKKEVEKLLDAGLIYPISDKSIGSARGGDVGLTTEKEDAKQTDVGGSFCPRFRCCHHDQTGAERKTGRRSSFQDFENPHKDNLEFRKNLHAGNFVVKALSSNRKTKFFKVVKTYFWDGPLLASKSAAELIDPAVCARQRRSSRHLRKLATMDTTVDIMCKSHRHKKGLDADSFWP